LSYYGCPGLFRRALLNLGVLDDWGEFITFCVLDSLGCLGATVDLRSFGAADDLIFGFFVFTGDLGDLGLSCGAALGAYCGAALGASCGAALGAIVYPSQNEGSGILCVSQMVSCIQAYCRHTEERNVF